MQLSDPVSTLKGVGPKKALALAEHGINTLEDLLYFFPRKYEDRRTVTPICQLSLGRDCLIEGRVLSRRYGANPYKKNTPLTLQVSDETGIVEVVFFQGRYVANLLSVGQAYTFFGRVSESMGRRQMIHPEFFRKGDPADVRGIIPIYPTVSGISQREIRKLQLQIKDLYPALTEWLPQKVVSENRLADPSYAVENMHFPKDGKQVLASRFRLIFEELLTLETGLFYIKSGWSKDEPGVVFSCDGREEAFIKGLPFTLTEGQRQTWEELKKDLSGYKAMNRLVQGDVGSGKTVIGELAMFVAAKNGYQSVMMAPTEILAKQHFASLTEDFSPYGLKVGLLCSSMKAAEKRQVLEALAEGSLDILVGTHAVIQPDVKFARLGMVITDEQHRFGVKQRSLLSKKGENPNVLVMTATPIPRTLAVILYGDLDISQIRTMPKGRLSVKTSLVGKSERNRVYDFVKKQLQQGRQAYVVAPLIEESESLDAKSAEELYEELSGKLKDFSVALVHGAMKQEEKDRIMGNFAGGKIDVLVSTVVIEVGINVPNAAVMVIENSERFGLAQLHQLRGRVGRGKEQSYCFLLCYSDSEVARERNQIMCETADGFEIAEADLRLRGPGEIFGTRQHGLPEMQFSDLIRHADVLERARDTARNIIEGDPALSKTDTAPLKKRIKKMFGEDIRMEL
ncbi:MAG: ATP-dependent DNA helicase RecG [Emergencia sp.]|nr:ATP-dependent DNA helicase RecG [Emergencia sp.]